MSPDIIHAAQGYLTVRKGRKREQYIDLEQLLKIHNVFYVRDFLREVFLYQKDQLVKLISTDKSNVKVDRTIAYCFRLLMAIDTLTRDMEAQGYAEPETP